MAADAGLRRFLGPSVKEIELALPGLRIAGGFVGGVSVPDCIENGTAVAEEVLGAAP